MYTRITKSGGRSYLQLVEGYRTETGAVRQKVVANLGRLDQLQPKDLDPLINGLNRALGRTDNVDVVIDVPDDQRVCKCCGKTMVEIGEDST